MDSDRLYVVCYDIADPKRWRAIYKTLQGYGEWMQLSVFQCRLTALQHAELIAELDLLIHHDEDHVMVLDIGLAEKCESKIASFGARSFDLVSRQSTVV